MTIILITFYSVPILPAYFRATFDFASLLLFQFVATLMLEKKKNMNAHEKCKEMAWPVVNAESGWLRVLLGWPRVG